MLSHPDTQHLQAVFAKTNEGKTSIRSFSKQRMSSTDFLRCLSLQYGAAWILGSVWNSMVYNVLSKHHLCLHGWFQLETAQTWCVYWSLCPLEVGKRQSRSLSQVTVISQTDRRKDLTGALGVCDGGLSGCHRKERTHLLQVTHSDMTQSRIRQEEPTKTLMNTKLDRTVMSNNTFH